MLFREMALSGISPPPELRDGKTLGWWDWQRGTTIDTSNYVSSWADRLNGLALVQASAGAQPLKGNGIVFDGSSDNMATGAITAINQPVTVYLCINQLSYTNADTIVDFNSVDFTAYYQSTSSGTIRLNAGTAIQTTVSTIAKKEVHTLLLNTAASFIQINNLTKATGGIGTRQVNRIMLANGSATSFGNIAFYDVIVRTQADSDTLQAKIKKFLAQKNGIAL